MPKSRVIYFLFILIAITLVYQSCNQVEKPVSVADNKSPNPTYVGDAACVNCHKMEVEKWQKSHHYHAMELPTEKTVLANWNGDFSADNMHYSFFNEGGNFRVAVKQSGSTDTFDVAYTFGYQPLQQYLVKADKGRLQTLRASWDTEKKQWFNQYAGEEIPKDDWLHFTRQSANWNSMCATCHSTDVTIGFNEQSLSYDTHFSILNVSCESCHGPASEHVALAEVSDSYRADNSGFDMMATSREDYVNMCGGCHARREQHYENVQPGDEFHDAYNIALLDERNYHADGQIREEDYVLGSFLSSKMYKRGVQCNNCHDSHSSELILEGNKLCMQCHEPNYDSKAHHFHELDTEGAQCVNCHMDGRTYMGNDYRRDHSFRIPRPDQSVQYGTPNACTSCHVEKSDEWASQYVMQWYGKNRPKHFSNRLLSGWLDGNHQELVQLAGDTSYPAISRATAIHYLGLSNLALVAQNISKWVQDESPMVRRAAIESIRSFPPEERMVYINKAIRDDFRSVRIEAIKSSLDIDVQSINPAYRQYYHHAENEYDLYLHMIADFPDGQGQKAHTHFQRQEYQQAIEAYKRALEIDSLRIEIRVNLAIVYNVVGKNEKALRQLDIVIAQEPTAQAYYLRGLLRAEMNKLQLAVSDLEEAIALDDSNPQYWFNLTLTYDQLGNRAKARSTLQNGLQVHPYNERLRSLISSL